MGRHWEQVEATLQASEKFRRALVELQAGYSYAQQTSRDAWDFALQIENLHNIGLSENDLRYLVYLQLVEHAAEVKTNGQTRRNSRVSGALRFTSRSSFILTSVGASLAVTLGCPERAAPVTIGESFRIHSHQDGPLPEKPVWDVERQVLEYGGYVVKHFRWQAANQELILTTFQEEGWPVRIADPLSPSPEIDTKRRLSDAIKCLNRKQVNQLIHFRGDGTGQAVVWESLIASCFSSTAE